jgi:ABC-type spermidine/putrescine transport system permease subunit II
MRRWLLLMVLAAVFVLPVLILALYGFAGSWSYPHLIPETFSLRAARIVGQQGWGIAESLLSSLGYSLAAVAGTFLISYLPASALAYNTFRGKSVLETLLILPAVLPAITYAVGAHIGFIYLSLEDRWTGVVLVLVFFSYPYMLRALEAGFRAVGRDYSTSAANLGAGPFYRLVRVELPLLLPAVYSGGIVVFLVSFSEYFLVFLIGGGAVPSITGYLVPYLQGSAYPLSSLLVLIFLALPLALFVVMELLLSRIYSRRGMTAG